MSMQQQDKGLIFLAWTLGGGISISILLIAFFGWQILIPWGESMFPSHGVGAAFLATIILFALAWYVIQSIGLLVQVMTKKFPTPTKLAGKILFGLTCWLSLCGLGLIAIVGISPSLTGVLFSTMGVLIAMVGIIGLPWMAIQKLLQCIKHWKSEQGFILNRL